MVVHWWVVKHRDFHGNFRVNVTCHFFAFFTGLLDLIWFERSLHNAPRTSFSRTKLSLAVKPDDVRSGRRDLDRNARLPVVQGRMGSRMGYSEEIVSAFLTGTGEFYPGGTPENSWWGCAARLSKSWPYFRPKHVIFHTRFQTRPPKSIYPFSDRAFRQNYVIIT